ncbi:MAG: hypothetical protein Q9195_006488 [Heterodermia aff. obscurata]
MQLFRHDWGHKHGRVRDQRSNQIVVIKLTIYSLIAIMLGRLEMTVEECIDNYIEMMDGVFRKTSHRLGFDLANFDLQIQGRFDTVELEAAIKRAVIVSHSAEDTKFRRADRDKCKVFVCAASDEDDSYGVQFCSWPRRGEPGSFKELSDEVTIWEAARATSAASTFFEPIQIGRNGQIFRDGATDANNPVQVLFDLARDEWGGDGLPFEHHTKILVSIGTGAPAIFPFGNTPKSMLDTLSRLATQTEKTAEIFWRDHRDDLVCRNAYLRLNVDHGLEDVKLEDASKRSIIATATDRYGSRGEVRNKINMLCRTARLDENLILSKALADLSVMIKGSQSIMSWQSSVALSHTEHLSSSPFSALDASARFLRPDVKSYWDSLTLDGLEVYEKMYQRVADDDGKVSFFRLVAEFPAAKPAPNNAVHKTIPIRVLMIWQRLAQSQSERLDRNRTLAVLYMLHMEQYSPRTPKRNRQGDVVVEDDRKLLIDCLGNWESCACRCKRKWNFWIEEGFRDDSEKERACETDAYSGKPRSERLFSSEARRGKRVLDATRNSWLESWKH